jgi:N-acetylmuramoyl-L-alanine amidase
MKAAAAIALLLCVVCGLRGAPAASSTIKFSLFGKEYVRLDQWARANAFQWKWLSKNEALLSNPSAKIQFTTDSRKMSLNGVTVLLSEAMRNHNGVPCITGIDLTTAIQPILFPPKNRPHSDVRHICIDPGHGGKQPGYLVGREEEKKYTLLLAQELGEQLRKAGYAVSFTRTTDTFVDLPARPDLARRRGADLFISLHFNAAPPGPGAAEIRGVEVYCMTPQRASSTNTRGEGPDSRPFAGNLNNPRNMLLAYELQKAITRGAGIDDRGVKRARFEVLRAAEMPAVLIEGGFMSSPSEARKIYSAAWRRQMAQSIVNGIASYRRIVTP